jgi:hypothetical protein
VRIKKEFGIKWGDLKGNGKCFPQGNLWIKTEIRASSKEIIG